MVSESVLRLLRDLPEIMITALANSPSNSTIDDLNVQEPIARSKSPKSLANEMNVLEARYIAELEKKSQAIQEKEAELNQAEVDLSMNVDDAAQTGLQTLILRLETELGNLQKDKEDFAAEQLQSARALDARIGVLQQEEVDQMTNAVSSIKRVVIECATAKTRTVKPYSVFSSLQKYLELHPV